MSAPAHVNKLKAAMQGMASVPDNPPGREPSLVAPAPRATTLAPSRRGKRNVSAYIEAAAAKQLRILAAERETSTQALLEEALNDLFRKYNRGAIA